MVQHLGSVPQSSRLRSSRRFGTGGSPGATFPWPKHSARPGPAGYAPNGGPAPKRCNIQNSQNQLRTSDISTTKGVTIKNSTDLERAPGARSKSVEFFIVTLLIVEILVCRFCLISPRCYTFREPDLPHRPSIPFSRTFSVFHRLNSLVIHLRQIDRQRHRERDRPESPEFSRIRGDNDPLFV